jgi:hypothetical protein
VGSIPVGVIGVFHLLNPCGRVMAVGSTQKPVSGIFPGGGGGPSVRMADNFTTSGVDCLDIWEPRTPGNLKASPAQ